MRFFLAMCSLAVVAWGQASAPTVRAGKYQISLRLPPEGLSAQEEMQIEYRVVDAKQVDPVMGAAPVIRAQARSIIDMPLMPTMAKMTEDAHPEGVPGEYGVHPLFPHGGEYRLQLFIKPPGGEEFHVQFPLQVGDAVVAKNRKPRQKPFYAEVRSNPKTPKAGEPATLAISVYSRNQNNELVREFDIQHERPIHLLVVREDLGEFAHEHPEMAADGSFRLAYTFPTAGNYTLFVDVAPKGAGGQVIPVRLKVGGKKGDRFVIGSEKLTGETASGSLRVSFAETEFAAGKTLRIACLIRDAKTGAPVADVQPYLGALGHLILVGEDAQTFVHSHPDELDPMAGKDGKIAFLARFPKAGRYRGWVQIQRGGVVETGPFTVAAVEK
jgi:hypothetical protein